MLVRLEDYPRAAAVATGLVNTAPEVMVRTGDGLAEPDALGQFLVAHDIRSTTDRVPTAADLAEVHELRSTLRTLIEAPDEDDVAARANTLTARAGAGPLLHRDDGGHWQWHVVARPGSGVADELALFTATGLLAVIRTLGHERFRSCALPGCNGVFVDTSRAGRRRYCEPGRCGSRINAANYRARRRTAQDR